MLKLAISSQILKLYDENKPASYIIHLDANNLFGHSIMQLFPNEISDWVGL